MKLILFTNLSRLPSIREKLDGFGTNGQNIAIVHQNNIFLYEIGDNNLPKNLEVILVNDNETVVTEDKRAILTLINDDDDIFVVYHNSTQHRIGQEAVFNSINYQQTSASHVDGSIYQEIDDWAKNGCKPEVLTNIIKKHFPDTKLEAVLEFLHQCLNDKIEENYLKILLPANIDLANGEGSIKNLFEKVKDAKKTSEKNTHLAALRDALLEKLGIV